MFFYTITAVSDLLPAEPGKLRVSETKMVCYFCFNIFFLHIREDTHEGDLYFFGLQSRC